MKKISVTLCCVFAFLGIIISGVKDAQAVHVMIYWEEMSVRGLDDAQRLNRSVFSYKSAGGLKPPLIGGSTAIIDIADRTYTQMRLLESELGAGSKRFVPKFGPETQWIRDQLYFKGFITIRWAQVRGIFWDQINNRFPTGPWRWASVSSQLGDDCRLNCDAQACITYGYNPPTYVSWCECEEWQGRWFCHKKNFFTYSDAPDQR